jgi:hypothetical protein
MSFEIYSIDGPDYLVKILPLFGNGSSYTSQELADVVRYMGLSIHPRRSRHLLQVWFTLGFLDRLVGKKRAYRYCLSTFGEDLLNKLSFNKTLCLELAHWAWYSAWWRSQDFERAWAWLYQDVCNFLWDSSPSEVIVKQIRANAINRAMEIYPDHKPALDDQSIGSILAWQVELDPPFLIRKESGESKKGLQSKKRDSCSPELLYLAIQLQYYIKNLPFNTPILIDDLMIESICKICLLNQEQFWPLVNICLLTFSSLSRKETVYGSSLTIMEPANFTPPPPRSLDRNQV